MPTNRVEVPMSPAGSQAQQTSMVDALGPQSKSRLVAVHLINLTWGVDSPSSATTPPSSSTTAMFDGSEILSAHDIKDNSRSMLTLKPAPGAAPIENQHSKPERSAHQSAHSMSTRTLRSANANLVHRTRSRGLHATLHATPAINALSSSSTTEGDQIGVGNTTPGNMLLHDAGMAGSTPPIRNTTPHEANTSKSGAVTGTGAVDSGAATPVAHYNNRLEGHLPDEEQDGNIDASNTDPATPHTGCTSRHFRVRCIIGRDSIDGDTYYIVSWKSSWVPSDQIVTPDDGQDRRIKIDGRDWLIARTIKQKVKKGVHKQLVRWVDDTLEPVKRLRRALPAIREFELKPRLSRRVVSFDESLVDRTKVLPQSEAEFRQAQIHLAKKWPMIEPRNDIDLLPAFRQVVMELCPRPEDDILAIRKTHQRLIDLPQRRRLRWSEEYLLSGRFYEYTPPRRNALLLQVVAHVADGCCKRCVGDTAPFKECVRDTSDDSPWFNGGCANCGSAEENSTCCHHIVGTAHLERRRTGGLKSERLRERIDPTRSISLFSNLEFEQDDDSDTYSADSYAESDNSSVNQPDDMNDELRQSNQDDDGEPNDDTINQIFCTPDNHSGGASISASKQVTITSPDDEVGFSLTRSTTQGGLSNLPANVLPQKRSMPRNAAALPTPAETQAMRLATAKSNHPSTARDPFRHQTTSSYLDRSSSTLAAETSASRLSRDGTYDDRDDEGPSEPYQQFDDHDTYDGDDPTDLQDLTPQNLSTWIEASEKPKASGSRPAVMRSVETSVKRPGAPLDGYAAASAEQWQASSSNTKGRKRAASRSNMYERASNRPSTESSRSSYGTSRDSPLFVGKHRPDTSPVSRVADSVTETKIDRGHTHEGCRINRPCIHPDHITPATEMSITVYSDSIDTSRNFNIGEVNYILSRCTCHWASAFSKVWNGWREESIAPEDSELTKPEFLLALWPEFLLDTARECCPKNPANRVTIIID
jgi:hypothetical protein